MAASKPANVESERTASRLNNFTDAAFALALSLLVIVGVGSSGEVNQYSRLIYRIPGYLFTFAIIANFWYAHVRWSRRDGAMHSISVMATLAIVFLVLLFVYPLRELTYLGTDYLFGLPNSSEITASTARQMVIFYGLGFAGLSGALTLLNRISLNYAPMDEVQREEAMGDFVVWGGITAIALSSAILAAIDASVFIAMMMYNLIPVYVAGFGLWQWNKQKKLAITEVEEE